MLSLQYLPPMQCPRVLYVAHNADYNGAFELNSARREKYLYDMFNLEPSRRNRRCVCSCMCVCSRTRARVCMRVHACGWVCAGPHARVCA